MKKFIIFIIVFIIITIVLVCYPLSELKTMAVMYPYSLLNHYQSILCDKRIELSIPGGRFTSQKDWFPFIMTFTDNQGFSRYTGKDLAFTVLYNFGHFEKGASSYYNPNSPYYSSFYGGYVIYNNAHPQDGYGFDSEGKIEIEELSLIPKYDQTILVLPSLGCKKDEIVFETTIEDITSDVTYIASDGWTQIDSTIETNSPIHGFEDKKRGYIQFGRPPEAFYETSDFPRIALKGRLYAKFFSDSNTTVVLYIMAPDDRAIKDCDDSILSKTKLSHIK